jgi:hypothetical protein
MAQTPTLTTLTFTPEQLRTLQTLVHDHHIDVMEHHHRLLRDKSWVKPKALRQSAQQLNAADVLLTLVYPD